MAEAQPAHDSFTTERETKADGRYVIYYAFPEADTATPTSQDTAASEAKESESV